MERGREWSKNIACVTLGTGVGGGIIVNGDIVQGVKGAKVKLAILRLFQKAELLVTAEKRVVLKRLLLLQVLSGLQKILSSNMKGNLL